MKKNAGRVGLLAGGPSSERKISIKSGRAVRTALKAVGCDVVWIDPERNKRDLRRQISKAKIDCAFIALHGRFGEDGTIQRVLEDLKIPYTGSGVRASRAALDKMASHKIFRRNGLNAPKFKILSRKKKSGNGHALDGMRYPLVVKPRWEGSSIGLSIIDTSADLRKGLDLAYKYGDDAIVEEYIRGRELTVGILEEKPLPVIQIVSNSRRFFDFHAKYKSAHTEYLMPAPIPRKDYRKAQEEALSAYRALGCRDFGRVDMILGDDGKTYVLEVNTIPGLTERSLLPKAAKQKGIDFERLCYKIVELAITKGARDAEKKKKKKG